MAASSWAPLSWSWADPAAILAPDIGLLGVALAIGLSLLVMAYVIGPVSGGNINPAVMLGLLLTKKTDTARAVVSWIGQVVGGIIGALIIFPNCLLHSARRCI